MKQFGKILSFELKSYVTNKIFVGVTVFLAVVIAVVMFFPRAIEALDNIGSTPEPSEGDQSSVPDNGDETSDPVDSDLPVMLIVSESTENSDLIKMLNEAFSSAFTGYAVRNADTDLEGVKEQIISGDVECAFAINSLTSYTYYVNNLQMYDTNTVIADEVLQNIYQMNAMVQGGISPDDASSILAAHIESNTENLGKDQMQNFFYTYIMIFALYMVILLYGQMVATNVATEKSSRAMELLVTSAKPTSMMFGKVMASCIAGLVQIIVVFGSALLFFNLNKEYWGGNVLIESIFDMPVSLFVYMLVFFVLGFFIYAFMYGAVGSTASKLEDINTSVMPITLMFIAGFFVVMFSMSSGNVDTTLMKVCSYIPFTSPMAMFTRIAMTSVHIYEIVISIVILVLSVVGVGVISAKIYRVGVLLYGTSPKLSSIIKAVWKA